MTGHQIIEEIEKRLMFSCNIMENEHCIKWLTGGMQHDENSQDRLFEPNVDIFQKLFGRHQFSFKLDKEYFVWRLNKGTQKMYCIAHEEGTFYEMYYSSGKQRFVDDEKVGQTIVEFLDFVLDRISAPVH